MYTRNQSKGDFGLPTKAVPYHETLAGSGECLNALMDRHDELV